MMIYVHFSPDMIPNMGSGDMLVHGCNNQGVMGAGIAKQIKQVSPKAFKAYIDAPKTLGTVSFFSDRGIVFANAITQTLDSFGRNVDYEAVYKCFVRVFAYAYQERLRVNFPLIGAGLGGGRWEIISAIIEHANNSKLVEKHLWVNDPEMFDRVLKMPYHKMDT